MDEKNVVNDFLGNTPQDIFKEESTIEPKVEEIVDEKPLPFHKDPKVQRYVEKQISKALEGRPQQVSTTSEQVSPSDVKDVIAAFTEIIGNDTPEKVKALSTLEKTLAGADERASQKAIERFQKQQEDLLTQATKADQKAQQELDDSFDEIEESYNVDLSSNSASAKKMRSEFIEYVRKIAPKDENGEVSAFPDLLGAFEDFQERAKRPAPTRAKELANRGLTRSSETTEQVARPRSWNDVDKHIAKLAGK